ncbi:MAG: hypothetical protein U5L00_07155 [Desulfovermiculus sp.]|nr:hypothetical protein [Desulfovermiculus sp.]
MRDLAKKLALVGLGSAVVSTSKVRETMQSLVHQGKLSTEEAERFTQDMCKTGEQEMQDIRNQITEALERMTKGMHLAQAEDVENLRLRVDSLEKRLNLLEDRLSAGTDKTPPSPPEGESPEPIGK